MLPHASTPDFLSLTDELADHRERQAAEHQARAAARQTIADPITREIGRHLSTVEAHEAHAANLMLLTSLARAHPEGAPLAGASDRVQAAFNRVRAQGNYSAAEALQRELDRDREDEMHALLLWMVN